MPEPFGGTISPDTLAAKPAGEASLHDGHVGVERGLAAVAARA